MESPRAATPSPRLRPCGARGARPASARGVGPSRRPGGAAAGRAARRAARPPLGRLLGDGRLGAARRRPRPAPCGWSARARRGRPFAPGLAPGEACRISTGALLPDGADAVVRREDGHEEGGRLVVAVRPRPWTHVRRRGEDLRRGQPVLGAGAAVAAHEVAVVAAAGHGGASCRRRARVAFLTTGDELVPPGGAVPPDAVIESNLVGLVAQAEAAGAIVCASAHAPDDRTATLATLSRPARTARRPPPTCSSRWAGSPSARTTTSARRSRRSGRAGRCAAWRCDRDIPSAWPCADATVVLALPGNPAAAAVCFHLLGRALLGVREDWSHSAPLRRPRPEARARHGLRAVYRGGRWTGSPRAPGLGAAELPRRSQGPRVDRARTGRRADGSPGSGEQDAVKPAWPGLASGTRKPRRSGAFVAQVAHTGFEPVLPP